VGERGIAAIARDGRILWERTNVDPELASSYAVARIERGGQPLLAMILGSRNDYTLERVQTLSLLDPLTGEVVRRVHVPTAAMSFQHDARRFASRSIVAVDLDGDGIDEIIMTFQHVPEAPSYTVLYEPRLDRTRILFVGVGHHDFAGVRDLDGDGKPEILLLGINNGLNWFNAIAAVRVSPGVDDTQNADASGVASPDSNVETPNLVWYALLPRGRMPNPIPSSVIFDDARRQITIHLATGRRVGLTYDGFVTDPISRIPPASRQVARRAAYEHFREGQRLFAAGFAQESVAESQDAVDSAIKADEPLLVEAMRRATGKLLIRSGKVDRGEQLLRAIAENSENASDIAFDAALALHLHGDVERAIAWYWRGAGKGGSLEGGKSKHEFLQGIVLGFSELGRGREAIAALNDFRSAYNWDASQWPSLYAEFIRWRNGERPSLAGISISPNAIDLVRYWVLEFRSANGEDPRPILHEVETLIAIGDDPQCVLWSLKAELLWKLGQRAEAAAAIRKADELLLSDRRRSVIARAHAAVIAERLTRITRKQI